MSGQRIDRSGTELANGIYISSRLNRQDASGAYLYYCYCHCGTQFVSAYSEATRSKSCGCLSRSHPNFADKSGLRKAYCWFRGNHKQDAHRMLTLEEFRTLAVLECHYC